MKLRLPANSTVKDCMLTIGLPRTLVKMDGLPGCKIAEKIATTNRISTEELADDYGLEVYGDHVIVDSSSI